MQRMLTVAIITLVGLLSVTPLSFAQCTNDLTIYGFAPVPSGYATFGQIVAPAGDVDNDTYPDILIADTDSHSSLNASVTVFSGLSGDSIRTFYYNNNTVRGASGFGDYNSDQYDDILVNGVVYSGLTGDTLADYYAVARNGITAGDINDDGLHDIIVANSGWSSSLGRVDVLSGATGDTIRSWVGSGTGGRFGDAVASAGDFNNDGFPDVVIGQPSVDYAGVDRGRVFVYSGFDGSELFAQYGIFGGKLFGANVASGGDLNNDGYADILITGQLDNSVTNVWAYSGQTGANLYTIPFPDTTMTPALAIFSQFGNSMDGVGDISNDGCEDFVVSAYRYADNRGNFYLFSGKDGSILYDAYYAGYENRARDLLGSCVAGVGDTDGDGTPNIAVGAKWAEGPEDPTNDIYYRGAAFIFGCFYPSYECQIYVDFDDDMWSNVCDNCKWFKNFDQLDTDADGVGDMCEDDGYVNPGGNRYTYFPKINWDWSGFWPQITFDTVLVGGVTHFELTPIDVYSSSINEIPFLGPMLYTFSTEAVYEGLMTVQLSYLDTGLIALQEQELQLFQRIDGLWRNITTTGANTTQKRVVGETYTMGEFIIGLCEDTPDIDSDGIGDLCDNCPDGYNPNQEDLDGNGIGDLCEQTQPLPAGSNSDVNLSANGVSIDVNFDSVDQSGDITASIITNGPAVGNNFTLVPADPPRYYEITTDALYSGIITITLSYDDSGLTAEGEDSLRLWHYEDYNWIDITDDLDTANNLIIGITTSLSPFALGFPISPTAVGDEDQQVLPTAFKLSQNYPNPFNPVTTIDYSLPRRSHVEIIIYNIMGQKVNTLLNEEKSAGNYSVNWNGVNDNGEKVSTGMYFYRIKAENYNSSKKMLLLK